jgi:hypothetical protein
MPPFLLIGLAAGLASSVLFVSATAGDPAGRLLLFFLAPLPAFLAGLGWGPMAAAVSAVSAALGCAIMLGGRSGLVVFLSQGVPIAVLCHLAQLGRAGPGGSAGGSTAAPPAVEWFPVGHMVAAATAMAGLLAAGALLLMGGNLDDMRTFLRELVEKVFLQQIPGLKDQKLTPEDISRLTELTLYSFPASVAFAWLGGLLLNFYLAGRITLASGRLPRPWPDLAAITYPRGFGIATAVALLALVQLAGIPALVASGFVGGFLLAYVLMGLAVAHFSTRGSPARPFILWGIYLGLLILNTWAALAIAMLGALEPILPWRRSKKPPGNPDT